MLAEKQYRYLSPVAIIRKSDRKLIAVHSAALTNKPAIVGMKPICHRDHSTTKNDASEFTHLCQLLQLKPEARETDLIVAASHEIETLRGNLKNQRTDDLIARANQAGKRPEARTEWAEELVALNEALFLQFLENTTVVVAPGRIDPPTGANGKSHAISAAARTEFNANPQLAALTSEDAYITDAIRRATG